MLVLLWEGVLVSNSLWGGASFGGSRSLSKIWDLASHKALVTGEWYIPGHRLMGFLVDVESEPLTAAEVSKGDAKVETTGMVVGDEQLNSMDMWFSRWSLQMGGRILGFQVLGLFLFLWNLLSLGANFLSAISQTFKHLVVSSLL